MVRKVIIEGPESMSEAELIHAADQNTDGRKRPMATTTRRAPKSQNVAEQNLGENVTIEVNDGVLTVTIDLSHRGERSTSGKTIRVASTNGNQRVPGSTVTLGLNAYVKP